MKNKEPQSEAEKYREEKENSIAIIGMACRLPGAENYEEFWENLKHGRSSIQEIPPERWDWKAYWGDPQSEINKSNSKWGGFIKNADTFDPSFFGLSAREVEATDPQQRIMLELTWACFEDAGICPSYVSGKKVGVYIGVFNFDYKELQERKFRAIETYHSIGTASAVIANRVSYYFNLKGPSFPIDTACSSSLNAIHSAIQSLHLGECSMAIAGGISLLLTPTRHISFSKTGMLSPTGSCKTFDESADGYVRSEGAGLILLKPLEKAIEDGDSIYGILKGSAVNHNGKTHTLTYPNPDAQAEVITEAHRRASITPESISYVEAHGTGTPKGDPMEFQGLLKAFKSESQSLRKNYCGLGSVKTNIGHSESAAGIAGVIKVLLSMKYKQLPGLHNFKQLNHRISIKDSPFYIVDKLQEWKPMEGEDKQAFPRRAGVSSFGFGGTNAHVVLEEAPVITRVSSRKLPCYLICLSAKTEEALRQKEEDLVAWLEKGGKQNNIGDVSATLLLGREHFRIRAAYVVSDIQELQEKLKEVLEKGQAEGYFKKSNPTKGKQAQPLLEELGKMIVKGLQSNELKSREEYGSKLMALAELYVKGHELDWKVIFPDDKIPRISLPSYPFAKERYWIPEDDIKVGNTTTNPAIAAIHPLLHQNTSDFSEQRFSSTFTGGEFFLADHVVKGQRILPGVAYIEMARGAVELALGYLKETQIGIRLKNIVWAKPIAVGEQPIQVHIGLFPEDNGDIAYEVYSNSEDAEPIVHSQGNAVLSSITEIPTLDYKVLQAQCSKSTLSSTQCYQAFQEIGINYGSGHKGIESVYIGTGQALAKLCLPSSVSNTGEQFILHPSMVDSAVQAAIVLMMSSDSKAPHKLALPFALQEIEVFRNCTPTMWSLVRYSDGNKAGGKIEKFDIDLCDTQGTVCARMKGLSMRVLEGDVGLLKPTTIMLYPCWKEQAVVQEATVPAYDQHLVILCEMGEVSRESIEGHMNGGSCRCLTLQSQQKGITERFQNYAAQVFETIQGIIKDKSIGMVLIQIMVPMQGEQQLFCGLSGLLKTARLENPKLIGQLIGVEYGEGLEGIIAKLKENSRSPLDNQVGYQDGKRWVIGWNEIEASEKEASILWKDRGIYLITGGAGGLGLIFAREIAHNVKGATLILTGRSLLNEDKQAKLKELQALGTHVEYKQVDVSDKKAVTHLIQSIQEDFGSLNGIIHSAGVIKDSFILKKNKEELQTVFAPKVSGLVNLDEASKDLNLDCFILFSSVVGVVGNPGQADYATANAFMDVYANYRNGLVATKQRHGQTLSINWPLWKDGGMHVDEETERMMLQNMGMVAMQTPTGIRALYQCLASGKHQVVVMEGDTKVFYATLLVQQSNTEALKTSPAVVENKSVPIIAHDILQEKATNYFKKLLSSILKRPAHRIEAEAPMENYGIDSILITQLTNQLEKTFGSLSKTLFFEYKNIQELTTYFLKSYRDQLIALLGVEENTQAPTVDSQDSVAVAEPKKTVFSSRTRPRLSIHVEGQQEKSMGALDIAIIGVSGRYPGAKNIQEFWKNLRDGRDCITEIPKDRWNYSLYFDEDKNKFGKTYSKWGGFLEGVDKFDPMFFNISPREAEIMDPQERLFLQCVYETLEDAGYTRESLGLHRSFGLEGNVGVYVGVMYEEYPLYAAQQQILGNPVAVFGIPASIANRVSYFCNFHGPSMTVDTMCSSSITAIHLACQSLQRGECEVSIAGGVNVSIHPNKYLMLAQGKFVSSKGRCESFGQGGDGYVPGEGVGAVLLKPLSKAIADGDHIYGIIKATAINHGGKNNGYTVPNPNAQASVIGRAFKSAGIDPRTISYIEAHGTGTSLGDPIEIAGLTKIFQEYTNRKQFCAIGSAKSNIGHCESAAGIAGVTKVLLQLKYRQLVPSLHSKVLNPNIDFINTPFVVQQELAEWKRPVVESDGETKEYPRIAGISSFGAGGSNAHVVIEEYIPKDVEWPQITITTQNPAIIVLSAKNEERLKVQVQQLLTAIREQQFSDSSLADIAYTLQVGREAMEERLAVTVESIKELEEKLKGFIEGGDSVEDLYQGQVKRNKEALAVFTADEELQEAIAKWIQRKKYTKLLNLWVKGLNVDWNKLYGETKPRRISLPPYPFSGERYWIPSIAVNTENRSIQRTMCFLKKQWELCSASPTKRFNRTIAILTTEETKELAILLSKHFTKSQILDINDIELQLPEHEWKNYDGCVDLTGCGTNRLKSVDWIAWLQKLIEYGHKEGLMILCVTRGLESYQSTVINLSGASRVGLYRMLQSEYSHLRSRHMDAGSSSDDRELAQQITSEFLIDSYDAEVCYRNGMRYRAFLEEVQEYNTSERAIIFPSEHVLWITGGTRGIGYLCAEHFVKHYGVKRLVLTGREVLPPREQWESYSQQSTSIAQKIKAIQALEAQGAEVKVLSVSLTDEQAVEQSIEEVKMTMGSIGGIIHCAGLGDFENPAFIRKSLDKIQQVLEPKVAGLDVLYQSFKNEPLQFFALFSSVSAIIPTLAAGQSDYAMANAYMDYVAEANNHTLPIISIQWPSWKETGMGEIKSKAYEQTGLLSMTNAEGLQLLDYILSRRVNSVVMPAVVNPDLWEPQQLMQRTSQQSASTSVRPQRPVVEELSKKSDNLVSETQAWLIELFSKELKIDPSKLESDIQFQEYGVDSVMLAQLLRQINQLVTEDLDPSILYEYSDIESLAKWLVSTHATSVSKALGASDSPKTQDVLPSVSQTVVREVQREAHHYKDTKQSDIAVVGLSCRFPGANTLEEYWQLLSEGRSGIRPVPQERWGYSNNFYAGLLDNITHFDSSFFLIPEEDARAMDPQALLVLEESLKLWYHAGYSHKEIKGKQVGVYIGARSQHRPDEASLLKARNPIVAIGQNYLAANISQFFDLRGPSVVVDTACSSALVGMNMAIQALHSGEIDSAIVGGVGLLTTDGAHRIFEQRGILSPTPAFHIFDKRANGVVLGEGAGMVLLKTVEQALTDGDCIYAVIKAVAINNDGRTAGPATPNIQAQREVLQAALRKSGRKPEEISYIEANGSGTEVTDLLELKVIQSAYRASNASPLGLGSMKPNIGHPLCAEGIAGFIKVVLMLQHKQLVPFLSAEEPMAHYDMKSGPFYFCRRLTEWTNTPRIAAINCFADGGTNAHVILEAWEGSASHQAIRQPIPSPKLNQQMDSKAVSNKTDIQAAVPDGMIWETLSYI